jgi:large-conductance mechanosensitive channel
MALEHKIIKTPEGQPDKVEVKAQVKSGKMKGRKVTVLLDADDVFKEQVGGFVNFLREHAIVGLAIGFVVGQQAQGVVKQLIASFIDPAFQMIFGQKLSNLKLVIGSGPDAPAFTWGAFIYVLLNLLFVLAIIYALVKIFNLDKLDKPKDKPAEPVASKDTKTEKTDKSAKQSSVTKTDSGSAA